jgi:MFS family permease
VPGQRRPGTFAFTVLLALSVLDAAGYSIIGPVLPTLAAQTGSGPALMGALAGVFPMLMLVGFAIAGSMVRAGRLRFVLLSSLACSAVGALGFAVGGDNLGMLFVSRAFMGFGSGGLWIGITFATLAYWPGREYMRMSRILAAYSVGALVGPSLGALGEFSPPVVERLQPTLAGLGWTPRLTDGVALPFAAYALLLVLMMPWVASLSRMSPGYFRGDARVLASARFWVSATAILMAVLATGMLDGVLPLHFSMHLSQAEIGLAYMVVACYIAVGAAVAGHRSAARMLALGAAAITVGVGVAALTTTVAMWAPALLLIGLGAGAAQTGATGLLLETVPTARIVTAMVVWSQFGIVGYLVAPTAGGVLAERFGYGSLSLIPVTMGAVLLLLAASAHRQEQGQTRGGGRLGGQPGRRPARPPARQHQELAWPRREPIQGPAWPTGQASRFPSPPRPALAAGQAYPAVLEGRTLPAYDRALPALESRPGHQRRPDREPQPPDLELTRVEGPPARLRVRPVRNDTARNDTARNDTGRSGDARPDGVGDYNGVGGYDGYNGVAGYNGVVLPSQSSTIRP